MVILIKDNGKMMYIMVKVNNFIMMDRNFKELGLMMRKMVKVFLLIIWVLGLNKYGQRVLKHQKQLYDY
jgi:hypothetical protein